MNENLIRRLVQLVDESDVHEIEFSKWGKKIRITKNPPNPNNEVVYHTPSAYRQQTVPAAQPEMNVAAETKPAEQGSPAAEEVPLKGKLIKSPIVGTFYRAPSPEDSAFVELGDSVKKGQTLCIIEAMKIMNEIESDVDGVVREILAENGDPVEFDMPLFRVE